jgi:hypothetical protein
MRPKEAIGPRLAEPAPPGFRTVVAARLTRRVLARLLTFEGRPGAAVVANRQCQRHSLALAARLGDPVGAQTVLARALLEMLLPSDSVRSIERRHWREQVAPNLREVP